MTVAPAVDVARRNRSLLDEALAVIDAARERGISARLLGGLAVMHHDASLRERGGSRPIADIDLLVAAGEHRATAQLLVGRGYRPEERFNALNGHRRMLFHGSDWDLDVLVGMFEMCHRIDMGPELALDYPTLPVTDLLLTKLQIVKLNEKDVSDIVDLVSAHEVGPAPGDCIDSQRLTRLVSDDWGLWRTLTGTLQTVAASSDDAAVHRRLGEITAVLDAAPKTRRWKLRSRIGDRVTWYVLPDEVNQ
jgi:hypothetical protein